jgi:hypothetical protein
MLPLDNVDACDIQREDALLSGRDGLRQNARFIVAF